MRLEEWVLKKILKNVWKTALWVVNSDFYKSILCVVSIKKLVICYEGSTVQEKITESVLLSVRKKMLVLNRMYSFPTVASRVFSGQG